MPPPPPPPPPAPGTAVTTGTSPSRGARRAAPASTRLVASGRASLARGAAESRTDAERLGDRGRKREDRGVREASTATPSSGSSRVPSLNRMSARGPCGAGGPCGPCGCAPLGTALGTALSQRSRAADRADRADRATATATQNDEDFALALLEQDLQEAEAGAREREARARRRANRRSLEEDELLAMMLAISQVQADEQQLQEALDESQRPHGEVSDAQLEQIQRKSLLESIRAQLPVTRWAKDSHQPGECALCLDEYSAGDCVTRLTCFHAFHKSCLDPWLDKSPTCPSCKFDLLSEIHGM